MKLSIIMPVFNGERFIVENIYRVQTVLQSYVIKKLVDDYEIVVVDDGSEDNTLKLIKENFSSSEKVVIVENVFNQGKGFAFKNGFFNSSGDVIVMIDSDLDIPPEQIENLIIEFKNGYDVVITSKFEKGSKLKYPLFRKIVSFGFYIIVKFLFGLPFKDTQTGLKLFKREVLELCLTRMVVKRFAFDLELILIAYRYNFSIKSISVNIDYHNIGNVKLKTIVLSFIDTIAIFYRLRVLQFYDRPVFLSNDCSYNFYFLKEDFSKLEGINTNDKPLSELKDQDYVIIKKYFLNKKLDIRILSSLINSYKVQIINGSFLVKEGNLKEYVRSSVLCSSVLQPFFSVAYRVVSPIVLPIPLSDFLCVSGKVMRYLLEEKVNLNDEEDIILKISKKYHSVLFVSDWSTVVDFKGKKIFKEFFKRIRILVKTNNVINLFSIGLLMFFLWLGFGISILYGNFYFSIPFLTFFSFYLLLKVVISGLKYFVVFPVYMFFSIVVGIIGVLSPILVVFKK